LINAYLLLASSLDHLKNYDIELFVYNDLLKYIQKIYGYHSKQEKEIYSKMANVYEKMGLNERASYFKNLSK
jgi:Holliday junction resolvasome RuvABC DNA-binding subunit